jgi:hypothetical protein
LLGESSHRITAIGQSLKQAFLLEFHQCGADGRSRHTKLVYQCEFGNPRTGWQFCRKNHFAQAQLRAHGL